MKNDAFSDNFPQKFFLSECLHAGVSPLWNPYMNFGFPTYADVGFAFYNPIVWLFALLGYNAYSLTLEVLVYLYIAGISMYRLGKYFSFSTTVAVAVGAMYMCSGVFVGGLQHINMLAAASFLPLLLHSTLLVLQKPCYRHSFLCSVSAYMVCTGGHPAIPIACVYFFVVFLVAYSILHYKTEQRRLLSAIRFLLLAVVMLILFLLPAVYSYLAILPEYERYAQQTAYNPIASTSLSGLFPSCSHLPLPVILRFFIHDVSFRTFYISMAGFIALFFGVRRQNKLAVPLLVSGIFLFLLSLGYPVKQLLFDQLPVVRMVRTNGHFRVFTLLSFCCLAGFGLERISAIFTHITAIFSTGKRLAVVGFQHLCYYYFCTLFPAIFRCLYARLQELVPLCTVSKSFYEYLSLPVALYD